MKSLILLALLASSIAKQAQPELPKYPQLKLDQESYLTDTQGVLNPQVIISLRPGDNIRIYLTDGTLFQGLVKETSLTDNSVFKVFGDISSHKNTGFGFCITKDGIFAGAVVQRDQEIQHTVTESVPHKGYILTRKITVTPIP